MNNWMNIFNIVLKIPDEIDTSYVYPSVIYLIIIIRLASVGLQISFSISFALGFIYGSSSGL